jgi:nitroimidazol reductase NimA-like FMN-containing flavoprotein (pyridoxamine 5'-phosphate oxidase superfamily)
MESASFLLKPKTKRDTADLWHIYNMTFIQTERTKLKRLPKRGYFDRETAYGILDEGFICHVGFAPEGQPFVIPTGYARAEDKLYIHGSQASRMLRTLSGGVDACVTVTIIDGLVLARSAFHHSMNYRSVVIFGRAMLVDDREEKYAALLALSEHIVRGRWADVREPTEQELIQTTVLSLPLTEASAKIRTGPPLDDEEDYAMNVWAGVVPLKLVAGEPINDPRLPEGIEPPEYARNYRRS